MRRCRSALFLAVFGVLLASSGARAQQAGGSALQGRVTDEQQAVLPGVSVVITNQDNGTYRETVTGPDGTFFATGLQPGRYKVGAELQGFKKFNREDVTLLLGSTQTVDVRLEVGGIAETVTVSEEAPPVDLTSSRVGGNVGSKELLDLPSPTRNFISFVAMVPGVQLNPSVRGRTRSASTVRVKTRSRSSSMAATTRTTTPHRLQARRHEHRWRPLKNSRCRPISSTWNTVGRPAAS